MAINEIRRRAIVSFDLLAFLHLLKAAQKHFRNSILCFVLWTPHDVKNYDCTDTAGALGLIVEMLSGVVMCRDLKSL
jgi:hypothetical protein